MSNVKDFFYFVPKQQATGIMKFVQSFANARLALKRAIRSNFLVDRGPLKMVIVCSGHAKEANQAK